MRELATADWRELQSEIVEWWRRGTFDFPWREPNVPEWRRLATEILLQRTHAEAVRRVYTAFFERFPDPADLGSAPIEDIEEAIHSLGLAWRAKFLQEFGSELQKLGGVIPNDRASIRKLPGIGPYASGAFLALHRDEPAVFVDANVVRLLGRYIGFDWDGETRRKRWFLELVGQLFNHEQSPRTFGYALLDFTRELCGQSPRCAVCPIRSGCSFAPPNPTSGAIEAS